MSKNEKRPNLKIDTKISHDISFSFEHSLASPLTQKNHCEEIKKMQALEIQKLKDDSDVFENRIINKIEGMLTDAEKFEDRC